MEESNEQKNVQEIDIKENIQNLIERCRKNDKDAQKEMYEYLRKITSPVAYSLKNIADKCGLNKNDFESCIYDAMFNVIFKKDLDNVKNFDSYFKTSYKYSVIAKMRENLQFYKNFLLGVNLEGERDASSVGLELEKKAASLIPKQRKEVLIDIMYDARSFFTSLEFSVLILVLEGFSLNEIMITLNITKYRAYRIYDDAIGRLKNIVKTLFPLFSD